MAEQTESDQHLTDQDKETFHDVDLSSDLLSYMMARHYPFLVLQNVK